MRSSVRLCLHIAVLFAVILLLSTGSRAYYAIEAAEPFSLREREHAPPSSAGLFFTVQDNFCRFTEPTGTAPLLLPHSDLFVPADIVEVNLPIFGVFSHPAGPSADPVAGMLYANLKIKKLLEEYAALQERAKNLLAEEPSAFSAEKSALSQSGFIHQDLKKIYFSLTALDETALPEVAEQEEQKSPAQQENKALLTAFQQLNRAINPPPPSAFPAAPTIATAEKSGARSPATFSGQPLANRPQTYNPEHTAPSVSSYQESITLPWILELPFKIFSYLLEHKITALVVGFFSLLLINIIFGSRS